jgi:hypothetical protein
VTGCLRAVESGVRWTLATALAVLVPATAFAQQPSARRVEVGGNLRWLTGMTFKDVNATEGAFGGATRTVFRSSTTLDPAGCAEGRVAFGLLSALDLEGAIAFGRTHLTTRLTGDSEAPDAEVREPVTEYLLEGGVSAHLARWRKGRAVPFVSAGVGYMRQLHDGHTLVEGGQTWYAGGGLRYQKNEAGHGLRTAGVRLELRATILTGGLALDGSTHLLPAVIAGVFFHP